MLEKIFEKALWSSRFIVILAVIFSLLGAITLFVVASIDIWNIFIYTADSLINHTHPEQFHQKIVSEVIGSIDLYLIAVVMIIFSFGIYELFISEIDQIENSKILSIKTLDQLKDKIAKVIIMVLVVSFFQRVLYTELNTALEMFYFALSISSLSIGMYFLNKVGK